MRAIHNIIAVAKYESITLFRSWFFRIFSILSLVFVFFYNFGTQSGVVGWPNGDMIALPSMIPFTNLYIINLAQAVIAVFLASEFLKQDKKLDTTEVVYMRSITNADYVIGKTLGNIWVFVMLNAIALGMVAIFNIASPYTRFNFLPYIYYFLLISIPTLIFIMGFSFFLMSVIKNQAVTFLVLLGYIAATLFYLQNKFHYIFDYMAFKLPMSWSEMVGFGNIKEILVHRGIYFFLGLGFICLTILLLKRLSQSRFVREVVLGFSVAFIGTGLLLGFIYIMNINGEENHRKEMVTLNNNYANLKVVQVTSCQIELEHLGNQISATAALGIKNTTKEAINEFVLTLNPGLEVVKFTGAGFTRELQLIKVKPDRSMQPGDSLQLSVQYKGTIDESFCYLDQTPLQLETWKNNSGGVNDKKHAFITPTYLLLTPETRWYPTAGISYSSKGLNWLATQFSNYRLSVKAGKGLTVLSQGKKTEESNGTSLFVPEQPLTQISVVAGNYQTRSLQVDKVNYTLSFFKGHNSFDEYFKVLGDSAVPVIRDLRKTWEIKIRREYPYARLQLVEIPVQFCSFNHAWSSAGEQVQPETVYLPEGGFKLSGANFAQAKKFAQNNARDHNETISPRETEANYLKRFINETFFNSKVSQMNFGGIRIGGGGPNVNFAADVLNPYFIFPNYYNYINYISSASYPITNRVVESYLSRSATDGGNNFMRNMMGLSGDEKGNIALQSKSFADILEKQEDTDVLNNVIQTKSGFLFALMKGAVGPEKFEDFIRGFLEERKFRTIPVEELNAEMRNSFNLDLDQYLPKWYTSVALPGYILIDTKAFKIQKDDQIKSVVAFTLTNTENIAGAITVTFRLGGMGGGGGGGGGGRRMMMGGGGNDDNIEKTVVIGAKESKRLTFLLNRDPRSMTINTYASHNLPSTISQRFEKLEIDPKGEGSDKEEVIPYTNGDEPTEIIADTEDPGFRLVQPISKSFIKRLFTRDVQEDDLKYKGMNMWNPQVEWTLTTNEQFYGKQIRSAYYCKGGTGERKAVWSVPIKEGGYYKIWAYIPKIRFGWNRDTNQPEETYNFNVIHDDGTDHPVLKPDNRESTWVEMGTYHFSSDSARVELTNNTKARTIYADAIKLVKER
jgi:ABC-type transport system involved in multi-copper enzyme maturation permease subunit